jgi:hypothetical protein
MLLRERLGFVAVETPPEALEPPERPRAVLESLLARDGTLDNGVPVPGEVVPPVVEGGVAGEEVAIGKGRNDTGSGDHDCS